MPALILIVMKSKITIILFLLLLLHYPPLWSQRPQEIGFSVGFAHFNDTDGFNVGASYTNHLNRYLDLDLDMSFAHTSDFEKGYRFSLNMTDQYWYTKSTVFNLTPLVHFVFIREQKHRFSFFAGLGYIFINAVDNTYYTLNENQFIFESTVEEDSAISRTIGIKYAFYRKTMGIGINARLLNPLKYNEKFFGQDNYRSINLTLIKKF
jgi:hypothetical protein